MRQVTSNRYHFLLAISAAICLLLVVRHALLSATFLNAGRYPSAAGFLLVAGLSAICLACAAFLARPGIFSKWIEATLTSRSVTLTWVLYAIIAVPALIFSIPEGWDEARHIQYGMFLRGYGMSGEPLSWLVVRSPMASFFSAMVFPYTQVINPVLLAALVAVMIAWCRQYSHPAFALFILMLFVANDHFMQAIWAVMGELPGALFLVASFYFLSRERFVLCAVCLAFAVLARWNLAPFALICVLFVAIRHSMRQALIMSSIGAVIFGVWLLQAWLLVGSPIQFLREYASHAHDYTDRSGLRPGVRPTVKGRLDFYSAALFFQTLPGLLAILVSFFVPRNGYTRLAAELFRFWLPASLLVYFLCIVSTGGYYPRLAVVTFPLSLLLFSEVTWAAWHHCRLSPRLVLPIMLGILPLAAASGVQGYDIVAMIGRKVLQPPPMPAGVTRALREHTSPREIIVMPKFYKITRQSNGRHLRVYTRRNIIFYSDRTNPTHELIFARTLEDEIRDFSFHVDRYIENIPPGMAFLLPSRYGERVESEHVVFEEDDWILARVPELQPH